MKLRELLQNEKKTAQYTFIICENIEDEGARGYRDAYRTTPLRCAEDWLEHTIADDYIVIKKDHAPIDVTGNWEKWYKSKTIKCAMITKPQTLIERYGEKQGQELIEYYEREIK